MAKKGNEIDDLPKDIEIGRVELRAIIGGSNTVNTCQTRSGALIPLPPKNTNVGTSDSDPLTGKGDISMTTGNEAGELEEPYRIVRVRWRYRR